MVPVVLLVTLDGRYEIHSLLEHFGRHIYQDYHETTGYNRICSKSIDKTVRDFFIRTGMMFLSYFVAMAGPMRAYFFYDVRTTTTELKFPFVAEDSDGEFIGNVICQACLGAVGMLAYTGLEVIMAFFDNFADVYPKLVEFELQNLDRKIEQKNLTKQQIKPIFRRIAKHAVDADKYCFFL